ncbi:mitochondrial ribosomal protein L17 [Flagelloscypha sp. PMI_526]|nr:mitochondrial ribosomal protein L17 [Flagelloscypha sp. PMI_526]
MKHGKAFRHLSRPPAHRMLMLRNMVTSLFQHEQIETTLAKAREAARLAEKMITLAKRGNQHSYDKASKFLLDRAMLPKLFTTFAKRYAERPGGYTRIHKYMNRPSDNAPRAILELVDNPKDLRWAITSRAVGWELLKHKLVSKKPQALMNASPKDAQKLVEEEKKKLFQDTTGILRPKTRWNVQKLLRYREGGASLRLGAQATTYIVSSLPPSVDSPLSQINFQKNNLLESKTLLTGRGLEPGQRGLRDTLSAETVAKGRLGNVGRKPERTIKRPVR